MPIYNADARLAAPTPTHTMTESAEQARQAVRSFAVAKRVGLIVTEHERPPVELAHPIPASLELMRKAALAAGYEVRVVHGWRTTNRGAINEAKVPAVSLDGIHRKKRRGFRATWAGGKAYLGRWRDAEGWHDVGVSAVKERLIG